jgi:heme/copper-type cytochrome/quinol oxidase subunit 3
LCFGTWLLSIQIYNSFAGDFFISLSSAEADFFSFFSGIKLISFSESLCQVFNLKKKAIFHVVYSLTSPHGFGHATVGVTTGSVVNLNRHPPEAAAKLRQLRATTDALYSTRSTASENHTSRHSHRSTPVVML